MANSETAAPIVDGQNADAAAEAIAVAARNGSTSFDLSNVNAETNAALDRAIAEATAREAGRRPEADAPEIGRENGGVRIPVEGEPDPAKVEADRLADEQKAEAARVEAERIAAEKLAAAPKEPPAKKGLLDDLLEPTTKTAPDKPAADPYDQTKLRSDASPKTQETFDNLKKIARERETAATERATAAETKAAELETRLKALETQPLKPEIESELKDLRAFRATFDVQNDPEFKKSYDTKVEAHFGTIYQKLSDLGLPAAELDKVKAMPPSERTATIDRWIELVKSPSDRRVLESKLAAISTVEEDRQAALKDAQSKADQILAEKRAEPAKRTAERDSAIATTLKPILPQLGWIHRQEIPTTATAADRARIEAANAAADQHVADLRTAIIDDSPQSRAVQAIAVPAARHYRALAETQAKQIETLSKELADIRRASSTSRTARTSASTNAQSAVAASISDNTGDALDKLYEAAQANSRR